MNTESSKQINYGQQNNGPQQEKTIKEHKLNFFFQFPIILFTCIVWKGLQRFISFEYIKIRKKSINLC